MLTFNKLVAGPEVNKSLLGLEILNTVHSSASVYICLEIDRLALITSERKPGAQTFLDRLRGT